MVATPHMLRPLTISMYPDMPQSTPEKDKFHYIYIKCLAPNTFITESVFIWDYEQKKVLNFFLSGTRIMEDKFMCSVNNTLQ